MKTIGLEIGKANFKVVNIEAGFEECKNKFYPKWRKLFLHCQEIIRPKEDNFHLNT